MKKTIELSERELEFVNLSCTDLSYKEISEKMYLSIRTIDGYRDRVFETLGVNSRIGLILYAIKNKLVTL